MLLLHLMKLPEERHESSFTDVRRVNVEQMNDSHGMETYGRCCSQGGVVVASGPIALQCCAEQLEVASDGCGMPRTMYGQRCTRSTKGGGYTLMPARRHGTIRGFIVKVSATYQHA